MCGGARGREVKTDHQHELNISKQLCVDEEVIWSVKINMLVCSSEEKAILPPVIVISFQTVQANYICKGYPCHTSQPGLPASLLFTFCRHLNWQIFLDFAVERFRKGGYIHDELVRSWVTWPAPVLWWNERPFLQQGRYVQKYSRACEYFADTISSSRTESHPTGRRNLVS